MCGLTGFWKPGGAIDPRQAGERIGAQTSSLRHRGPDGDGTWMDAAAGIALGHRRLAIIDLSDAGRQPMISSSGRFVLVYNGEIYNHLELRAALELAGAAPGWRGHSDTETLLAAFECWGIEDTLNKANGMFAIALWDREARALTLARDRMGEKPLYYGWQGDTLLFGSELKALRAHPSFHAAVNRDALAMLLRSGYIAAPVSIYQGIHKLPAGSWLTLDGRVTGDLPRPRSYWSLREVAGRALAQPFAGGDREAIDRLDAVLRAAVLRQTLADVPLGAFLSGGIDSTTVVALLQAQSARRVRTFSIGFHEAGFDEARHAAAVAAHLGTEHAEMYVSPRDALDVIPALPEIYDEPFGDSSAIPTCLVARFARRHVTVCLSGDGGDELFGGYARYHSTEDLWRSLRRVPRLARGVLARGCAWYAQARRAGADGWRAERLALYLAARDADECYQAKTTQWHGLERLVRDSHAAQRIAPLAGADPLERMMFGDSVDYLPDDILAKVDRAAMAVSLETRIPMLDPAVVEFAWSLPRGMKVRDGHGKWLLRQLVQRYVPASLMERPKMGFGVPVGEWLRGPLRDWAEDLLAESRLRSGGYFDAAPVRARWARHLSGAEDGADALWPVLMFQAWLGAATAPGTRLPDELAAGAAA